MKCPGGSAIELMQGYWFDPSWKIDEVLYCYRYPNNCIGNEDLDNSSDIVISRSYFPCAEGHIGALCEVCDI